MRHFADAARAVGARTAAPQYDSVVFLSRHCRKPETPGRHEACLNLTS